MDGLQGFAGLAGAGIAGGAALLKDLLARGRAREQQFRDAAQAFTAHYLALERFVEDPGAPADLCAFLLDFSDAIEDDDMAVWMAEQLCTEDFSRDGLSEFIAEVDGQRQRRSDLAALFDQAFRTGITAMFLRQHRTAALYQRAAQRFTANPAREIHVAARIVGRDRAPGVGTGARPRGKLVFV